MTRKPLYVPVTIYITPRQGRDIRHIAAMNGVNVSRAANALLEVGLPIFKGLLPPLLPGTRLKMAGQKSAVVLRRYTLAEAIARELDQLRLDGYSASLVSTGGLACGLRIAHASANASLRPFFRQREALAADLERLGLQSQRETGDAAVFEGDEGDGEAGGGASDGLLRPRNDDPDITDSLLSGWTPPAPSAQDEDGTPLDYGDGEGEDFHEVRPAAGDGVSGTDRDSGESEPTGDRDLD